MTDVPDFHPDRSLYPFRSRHLRTRRARLHWVRRGSGPPLLFLHGNPTWSFLYRELMRELSRHFTCIAVDYPGFGLSERPEGYGYTPREHAEAVRELVRRLDLRDLTIFGHDWGGPIGMRVALDERPRVRALVMGNTWYWPADSWRMRAFSALMSTRAMQWLIRKKNFFVRPLMGWGMRKKLSKSEWRHYRSVLPTPASREGVAVLPRAIRSSSFWLGEIAYAVPRRLGNLPLLLVWGKRDLAFPRRMAKRFRKDFDDVTEVRLDASHYIQEDAPEEIARAIRDFFGIPRPEEEEERLEAVRREDPFGPVGIPPEYRWEARRWYAPAA